MSLYSQKISLFIKFWIFFYSIIATSWFVLYYFSTLHVHLHDNLSLIFMMWSLMVLAMMTPTIIPYLRFYADLKYTKQGCVNNVHLFLFTIAYIIGWLIYAIIGTILQYILEFYQLLNHQGSFTNTTISITIIFLAAIYNILPIKLKALSKCQSPIGFFIKYWKPSYKNSVFLGFRHSLDCIQCCWVLMSLMLVGTMSDLRLMIALTAIMIIEKISISGKIVAYLTSLILASICVIIIFTDFKIL